MTRSAPPAARPAHTFDAATVLAMSRYTLPDGCDALPDSYPVTIEVGEYPTTARVTLGDIRKAQSACGLRPAGLAASAVVDRAAREMRQRKLDDFWAWHLAFSTARLASFRAMNAFEHNAPTADETLREAMAALDAANALAKRIAGDAA